MVGDEIPDDVRRLLEERIETYEHLEVLLFLATASGDLWGVDTVAERLGITTSSAGEALDHLTTAGLLATPSPARQRLFGYQPENAELDAAVRRLQAAYADRRLAIMNEMTANALQRVRTAGMRAFARAFLFDRKGGKPHG